MDLLLVVMCGDDNLHSTASEGWDRDAEWYNWWYVERSVTIPAFCTSRAIK